MNLATLEKALSDLPTDGVRYFPRIGSTNDEARRWSEAGAPDLALVAADEQTAGRGRLGRQWQTPPGSALAFSLVMHPPFGLRGVRMPDQLLTRLNGLGGLAVSQALERRYRLETKIKWPNDVLLGQRKASGVLAEALWQGDLLQAVILGVGVNITPKSILGLPDDSFPAASIETILGRRVDPNELLHDILERLLEWRPRLGSDEFLQAWEDQLAWREEWVEISQAPGLVQIQGLNEDGSLRVVDRAGQTLSLWSGY